MQRAPLLTALLFLACVPALAQDPVKVEAKQCKVVLENDYVRVLHWNIAPQEKSAMHDHPAMVSISLSGGKTRFRAADGKTRDVDSKPGQVTFSEAEKHASEGLDDKAGEVIQVELKEKPGTAMTKIPASEDSVKVDPKHYHVEFQNDRVRVLRIKYAPGEKSVMHAHPANVAVFLTDGKAKMTMPDGKSSVLDRKVGQVLWSQKGNHLPENVGGKPLEVILVELK